MIRRVSLGLLTASLAGAVLATPLDLAAQIATWHIYWAHRDGSYARWAMSGTTLLRGEVLVGADSDGVIDHRIAGIADFGLDRSDDAIVQFRNGHLTLWPRVDTFSRGTNEWILFACEPYRVSDPDWKVRAAADMNGDRRPDLLWQHETTGRIAAWFLGASNRSPCEVLETRWLTPDNVPDPAWKIVGAGDMNGDRWPDLYWHHQTTGHLAVWLMNGTTLITGGTLWLVPRQVSDTDWKVRAVADLNGDRQPDLLWQNQTTGILGIWYMSGTTGSGVQLTASVASDTGWQIVGAQ